MLFAVPIIFLAGDWWVKDRLLSMVFDVGVAGADMARTGCVVCITPIFRRLFYGPVGDPKLLGAAAVMGIFAVVGWVGCLDLIRKQAPGAKPTSLRSRVSAALGMVLLFACIWLAVRVGG